VTPLLLPHARGFGAGSEIRGSCAGLEMDSLCPYKLAHLTRTDPINKVLQRIPVPQGAALRDGREGCT
jgi:hypothetical protein